MQLKQQLMEYCQRGSSSVKDTVSGSKHTPDFAYARNQYLGCRLRVVCWIFIILSPLWALFDHFLLPPEALFAVRPARVVFFLTLVAIQIGSRLRICANRRVILGMRLFLVPPRFYSSFLFLRPPIERLALPTYFFFPLLLFSTATFFP